MKNPYAKNKGKIHPTPSGDALAVLHILPAAVLALVAALGVEDKEVLAYLVTRSIKAAAAGSGEGESKRCSAAQVGAHRALFDCGCFECYMSFWLRWDSSPDREVIHQAIEAFEEHLASSEKRRRRDRRGAERRGKAKKKGGEDDKKKVEVEKKVAEEETRVEEEEKVEEVVVERDGEGERRRGWADVMGMVSWRLWNLWSPGD